MRAAVEKYSVGGVRREGIRMARKKMPGRRSKDEPDYGA